MPPMKPIGGASLMTAQQLLEGGSRHDHCELWDGVLMVHEPAGPRVSSVCLKLGRLLGNFVEAHGLGQAGESSGGFWL